MLLIKRILTILIIFSVFAAISCDKSNKKLNIKEDLSVLVFITGVIAGSPTYEMMTQGALEFSRINPNTTVKIYEAGMNQAEWEQQLGEMISSHNYDVVISSNPALPVICVRVSRLFPDTKFIIFDALYEGHPQIKTYHYNQYEQSLFLGYLAGLITTSNMKHTNNQKKIGFIAAQEYPLLTGHMIPGFIEGAKMVDEEIELDFRVIGNWYDASKASELASAMINSGVDVFTSIAGGAAQGLIKTAVDRGAYIVWYNNNAYNSAPGIIVGCGIMEQKKLTIEVLNKVMKGEMEYGTVQTLGIKDGYLGFIFDDPGYYENLSEDIRLRFEQFMSSLLP